MKLKPLNDRVLVQPLAGAERTEGGLYIPTNAQEKQQDRGIVIAVGPGALNERGERKAPDVKEGDEVLFGKYSGIDVKLHNEDMKILKADEIIGILISESQE